MKSMMRRGLAAVLTVAMLLSMLAVPAFAAGATHEHGSACEHKDQITPVHVDATCAQNGGDWYYCTVESCGRVWVENLQPKLTADSDHTWVNDTPIPATCTEPAKVGSKCSVCGKTKNAVAVEGSTPLDHDWKLVSDSRPENAFECIVGGTLTYECQRANCGKTKTEKIDTKDHDFALADVYKAANCEKDGFVTVYCQNVHLNAEGQPESCTLSYTVILKKTGHTGETLAQQDPTCTEPGYEAGVKCTHIKDDDQDGHPDAFDDEGNPVLCSEQPGDEIPELGHHWVAAGTPDADGYIYVKTVNGKLTVVDAATEGAEKVLQVYAGVCKEAEYEKGWKYEICDRTGCGLVEKHETEPEHDPEFVSTKLPTCTQGGYDTFKCKKCGKYFEKNLTDPEHKFSVVGSTNVIYTYVDQTGDTLLDDNGDPVYTTTKENKTGYTAIAWSVQQEAACGKTGIFVHACEVEDCGATESFMIRQAHFEKTVADYPGYERQVTEPTCDAYGYTKAQCAKCGVWYEIEELRVSPKGHQNEDGSRVPLNNGSAVAVVIPAKDATCEAPGYDSYSFCYDSTCALNANEGTVRPQLQHKYDAEKPVAANCKLPSYKIYVCSNPKADGTPCGAEQYKDETLNPGLTKTAWDMRVPNSEVGSTPDTSNHVWVETGAKVDATCAANGKEASYTCSLCNLQKNGAVIPQLTAPNWKYDKTNENATCTKNGYWIKYCEGCKTLADADKVHTDVIEIKETATGEHFILGGVYSYDENGNLLVDGEGAYYVDLSGATPATHPEINTEHPATEGTCDQTVNDYHRNAYKCKDCGEVFVFSVRPAHKPDGSATCTDEVNCTECGTKLADKLGHDHSVFVETVAPTCTADGYDIYQCSRCTDRTDAADKKNHVEKKGHLPNIPAATCEIDKVCTRTECQAMLENKTGHTDTVGVRTPATCQAAAYITYTCTNENCDHKDTNGVWSVIDGVPSAHEYVLLKDRTADCLLYGVVTKICKFCREETMAESFVAAYGHNYGDGNTAAKDGTVYNAPNCTTAGSAYKQCTVCATTANDTWKTAADWQGNTGYIDLTSAYENMGATGHHNNTADQDVLVMNCQTIKDIIAKYEGQTLADDVKILTCKDCATEFSVAKAHEETMVKITVAITCKQDGYTANYCLTCGEQEITSVDRLADKTENEKKALHDYEVTDQELPTYTSDGHKTETCKVCGDVKTTPLPCTDGLQFTASVQNVRGKAATIVNNSVIAYTISISASKKAVYMIQMAVGFDNTKLDYIGFDLGADGMNAFGSMNAQGESTTSAEAVANAVNIFAYAENDENGNIVNAEIDGTVEFITLYFRVKGDSITDKTADKTFKSAITMDKSNITIVNKDIVEITGVVVENADQFSVKMLGDVNGDGVINLKDAAAVRAMMDNGYKAEADIDMDGVITSDDFAAIQKYIIGKNNYQALLALGVPA